MASKVKASSSKAEKQSKSSIDVTVILPAVLIIAAFMNMDKFVPTLPPASNKPFSLFEEFFPFYISQHADETCRRLHFVGTTLVILYSLYEPFVLPSLAMAGLLGNIIFHYTRSMDSGLIEMGLMLLTFLFFSTKLTGSFKKSLMVPIVAYTFAWVGHFVFENNRPATFIYPTYSLMGDFRMWYEIASQQRAF
jgi:hypothetical protein